MKHWIHRHKFTDMILGEESAWDRYYANLPWSTEPPPPPLSQATARRLLLNTIARFQPQRPR